MQTHTCTQHRLDYAHTIHWMAHTGLGPCWQCMTWTFIRIQTFPLIISDSVTHIPSREAVNLTVWGSGGGSRDSCFFILLLGQCFLLALLKGT